MRELRYTLVGDGSSDRALLPILNWLLRQHVPDGELRAEFHSRGGSQQRLSEEMKSALALFDCEILFVHRDAERQTMEQRRQEVREALQELKGAPPHVCVVPVRMAPA